MLVSGYETSQAAPVSPAALDLTIPAESDQPLRFAADELQRYLALMTGRSAVVRVAPAPANTLVIGNARSSVPALGEGTDSFAIVPSSDGALVQGGSGRAVLHGVYALLAQLGCRWSLHGRAHEQVPRLTALPPITPQQVTPRFNVRGYSADIMTWHYGDRAQLAEHLTADHEFVDWMGKSAANAFLFIRHPFDTQLTIPELLADFARRGIDLEYGGHVIPLLLPREQFGQHPEYFPQSVEGARSEFGNLCTASRTAMRIATENAVHYVREYPELHVLHIWGADLWAGGWCHCGECRSATAQDQSLRLCNAVAEALAAQGMARSVCYIAYHDTLEPNLTGRPAPNVVVEYAPRERCYGHALDDGTCRTNRRYREALERYVELFDGRVRIFEYYADAILFCGCAVPLGEVIAGDLDFYHRLGIREITNLQFGSFSLWAYPLNFLAYAAATQAPCADVSAIRHRYAGEFGTHADLVAQTFADLEAVMREIVTYGDIRRPPKPPEQAQQLRPRVERALERLAPLVDRLAPASSDAVISALQALLRYNRAMLTGVRSELGAAADAAAHYDDALAIMRTVDRRFTGLWGAVNLPVIHAYHSSGLFSS